MENWFFALLDELARIGNAAPTVQENPDYAWGMRDEFVRLAEVARQKAWVMPLTPIAASAWAHQQRERIRQRILIAENSADATFRMQYHLGALAACSMVLMRLGTLPLFN